jgi:hypothetical protein
MKRLGYRVAAFCDQKAESSLVNGRCRFADGIGHGTVELKLSHKRLLVKARAVPFEARSLNRSRLVGNVGDQY